MRSEDDPRNRHNALKGGCAGSEDRMLISCGPGVKETIIGLLGSDAGTLELKPHALPTSGFLISVPEFSMAGRGRWGETEIENWWNRVEGLCTEVRPWFAELRPIRWIGERLGLSGEESVLFAGTWNEGHMKWFDVNLHVRDDLEVGDRISLTELHPASNPSPASRWQEIRGQIRHPDALDIALSVGRSLHQAEIWELDKRLPDGGRTWPVWY
ncbi:hypothetical protein ACIA5D_27385 [Actinoplanes sp. NPDC051513]|uniref:hypothetical protein n=1 Tax=Actinoplanes sp. NPDC051513 TaxID=3363908 RepID=UPI0037927353